MSTFKINNVDYPHPLDFAMKPTANIVSSITTMSGKTIGDINGQKYENVTLKWDYIEANTLTQLLSATDPRTNGSFAMTFVAPEGNKTVNAIRESFTAEETPSVRNGSVVWTNIQMTISFPDCYQ